MTRIFALVAVGLLLFAGAAAVNEAYEQSGKEYTQDGESWTPNAGNWTTLQESNLDVFYEETVDVRDNNGNEMIRGEDYDWNSTNGTVKAIAGGRLDGVNSAEIDYGYHVTTDQQEQMASLFASGFEVAHLVLFILAVALALAAVRAIGGA